VGHRALDVRSGPGALTAQLVERLGADAVSAIDPSPSFVAAIRARLPQVDVRSGVAEHLPFPADCFDLAVAQLVVPFMNKGPPEPVTVFCTLSGAQAGSDHGTQGRAAAKPVVLVQ
jgi:trans-aconitate methyltransferase